MQAMYFWRIHQRGCAEGVDADARPVAWYRRLRTHCSHSSYPWHDLIFNLRTFL